MAGSSRVNKRAKSIQKPIENLKDAVQEELTILWDRIEDWRKDNHYILSGYRQTSNSYLKSAASLKYLHNESVNIWSHLVPAGILAFYGPILLRKLSHRYVDATRQDLSAFGCFFLGAVLCLGMSATFHTISNHSESVSKFGNRLDYLGIVFLIIGSFIPSIYYGFGCDPKLITTYLSMITTIGAGCAVVSLSPKFASPKWRPFRASMFVAMGLSAVFPVIHGLKLYGVDRMVDMIALPWLVSQGTMYVLGAAIYAVSA